MSDPPKESDPLPHTPKAFRKAVAGSWKARVEHGVSFFTSSAPVEEAQIYLAATIPQLLEPVRDASVKSYKAQIARRRDPIVGDHVLVTWEILSQPQVVNALLACETVLENCVMICADTLYRCSMCIKWLEAPPLERNFAHLMSTLESMQKTAATALDNLLAPHRRVLDSGNRIRVQSAKARQGDCTLPRSGFHAEVAPGNREMMVFTETVAVARTHTQYLRTQLSFYQMSLQLIQMAQAFIPQHLEMVADKLRKFEATATREREPEPEDEPESAAPESEAPAPAEEPPTPPEE